MRTPRKLAAAVVLGLVAGITTVLSTTAPAYAVAGQADVSPAPAQTIDNIGGGGVGVTNPVRAPQTFRTNSGGFDWSRTPAGRPSCGTPRSMTCPT